MPLAGLHEEMHNAIRSRFDTQIVSGGAIAEVVYDNERESTAADSVWAECIVADTDTELIANGGAQTYRKRGELVAKVNGPLGQGDGLMLRAVDAVRSAFDRVTAGDVTYGVTSTGLIGRTDQWWRVESTTPFYSDDLATRSGPSIDSWAVGDRERAANAIRSEFDSRFGSSGSVSTNTVIYDNDPTDPPSDSQWISFSLATGSTEVVGAGASAWARTMGIATAMIFTPLGIGTKQSLALADSIVREFRQLAASGMSFDTPYLSTIGRRNQWWQTNCNLRFRIEEIAP